MADILFSCPRCSAHVAADSSLEGKYAPCVECGQNIPIPVPMVFCQCDSCRAEVRFPSGLANNIFTCPNCENEIVVPTTSPLLYGGGSAANSAAPHGGFQRAPVFADLGRPAAPASRSCPYCNAPVASAAIVCMGCGKNLVTGRAYGKKVRMESASIPSWTLWAVAALALVAGAGIYLLRKHEQASNRERIRLISASKSENSQTTTVADVATSTTAMTGTVAVAKVTSNPTDNKDQKLARQEDLARQARMDVLRERIFSEPQVSLFDALARMTADGHMRLAVDPECLIDIGQKGNKVSVDQISKRGDAEALDALLGKYGLVRRPLFISQNDTNLVDFVTTDAFYAYSLACWRLKSGQINEAIQAMNGSWASDTRYGQDCAVLQRTLVERSKRLAELDELALRIKNLLAAATQLHREATGFHRASKMSDSGGLGGSKPSIPEQRLSVAAIQKSVGGNREMILQNNMRDVCACMDKIFSIVDASNKSLYARLNRACEADFPTERNFLLSTIIADYEWVSGVITDIEKTGLLSRSSHQYKGRIVDYRQRLSNIPASMVHEQRVVRDWIRFSLNNTGAARLEAAERTDTLRSLRAANTAWYYDRCNPMARAGAGYFRIQLHAQAMQNLFSATGNREGVNTLIRSFYDKGKRSMFMAALKTDGYSSSPDSLPVVDAKPIVGRSNGLVVGNKGGIIYPVSVMLQDRDVTMSKTVTQVTAAQGYGAYWSGWTAFSTTWNATLSAGIVFEDYGDNNYTMYNSANEVYKWLTRSFKTNMVSTVRNGEKPDPKKEINKSLHISFHDLYGDREGDSAGAALATAAYSFLHSKPVRQDTAMTGALHADGTILSVGGIYDKIMAAAEADGVEIVIVPRKNEGEIGMIPADMLCRIIIVSANNIQTYLDCATDPEWGRDTLDKVRKAQILLLTGRRDEAEPLLLEAAADMDELYTARRLLELLSFWKKTELALAH